MTEALYQRLIFCFRETGQTGEAIVTYHRCRDIFERYLQIRPSAKTLELLASLKI